MSRTDPTLLRHAKTMRREPTPAERSIWRALRNRQLGGARFRRQEPMGGYIADFFSPEGLHVVRVWNSDVLTNLEGVLIVIASTGAIVLAAPPPPPFPHGEGEQ